METTLDYKNSTPTQPMSSQVTDARRKSDLLVIQSALDQYFTNTNQTYPDTLEALVPVFLAIMHQDPMTHIPYSYIKVESNDYQLCATFDEYVENDSHTVCFSSEKRVSDLVLPQ